MLKKIFKNKGVIIVEDKTREHVSSMEVYYYIINKYEGKLSWEDYMKKYYILHGFTY